MSAIPSEMNVLQIQSYNDDPFEAIKGLEVVKKVVPKPLRGQVLIRVDAAPCNPSDLLLLQGRYGKKKSLPAVPGWEGAGTVVASGSGMLPRWLKGKRVAFSIQSDSDGTWSQYCVADAKTCIVLKDGVDIDQGATLIINPLTAVGLVDTAVAEGHKAIIQNGAASQLGRMVVKLTKEQRIPSIHIVRRQEQADLLHRLGADIVLNSEDEGFDKSFKEQSEKLGATVAFDAVAGSMTGRLLALMPERSKVFVYGALSGSNCSGISPLSLIFQEKSVEGFFLSSWIHQKGFWGLYQATNRVQRFFSDGSFHTSISKKVGLKAAPKALEEYQREMTAGKVIIKPQNID